MNIWSEHGRFDVTAVNSQNSRRAGYCVQAGLGVYWGPDHPDNVSRPVHGSRHTNNVAEIQVRFSNVGFWTDL